MTASLVLVERFNRTLLRATSVSFALQEWCGDTIRSVKIEDVTKPATPEQRRRLGISPQQAVEYRSVHLVCRDTVITHAEIWYLPDCLTAEMRDSLRTTELPFGVVVQALRQKRENFAVYERASPFIFEHRAVLVTGTGTPFGIVHERHRAEVLAFHGQSTNGAQAAN